MLSLPYLNPTRKVNLSKMPIPLVKHGQLTPHPTQLFIQQSSPLILKLAFMSKSCFFFLKAFSSYLIHNIRHIALMQNGLSTVSLCLLSQLLSIHLADLDIVASHPHLIKDPHSSLFNTGDCIGIFSSELVTSQDMSRSKKGICYPFCM